MANHAIAAPGVEEGIQLAIEVVSKLPGLSESRITVFPQTEHNKIILKRDHFPEAVHVPLQVPTTADTPTFDRCPHSIDDWITTLAKAWTADVLKKSPNDELASDVKTDQGVLKVGGIRVDFRGVRDAAHFRPMILITEASAGSIPYANGKSSLVLGMQELADELPAHHSEAQARGNALWQLATELAAARPGRNIQLTEAQKKVAQECVLQRMVGSAISREEWVELLKL
ncbi:hypothetical protein BJX99DRAFT_134102 [Aspergillus californicus]